MVMLCIDIVQLTFRVLIGNKQVDGLPEIIGVGEPWYFMLYSLKEKLVFIPH